MEDWQKRVMHTDNLKEKQADRTQRGYQQQQSIKEKQQDRNQREALAEQRNRAQQQIAENRQQLDRKKMELSILQKKEDQQIKLTTAEIDRKKELELAIFSHKSTYNLKEQDLEHGFLNRQDEFEKSVAMKNGEYAFTLQRDKQAQRVDLLKTGVSEFAGVKKAQIQADANITIARTKEMGATARTALVEENKYRMQVSDIAFKKWAIKENHYNALEMADKMAEVYERNAMVDTRETRIREQDKTAELIKRNFDESINYIMRGAFDTKYKMRLMELELELEIKRMEAEARIFGGRKGASQVEIDIDKYVSENHAKWESEL